MEGRGDDGTMGGSPAMPGEDIAGLARILIVDDEESNVVLLQRILEQAGFEHVVGITDPLQAVPVFAEFEPDLVLLDIHMPHLDGFEVVEQLRPLKAENEYLPTMILTADVDPAVRRRANVVGVEDFLVKPFERTEVVARVKNLLETRFRLLAERGTLSQRPQGLRVLDTSEEEHLAPVYPMIRTPNASAAASPTVSATDRSGGMWG